MTGADGRTRRTTERSRRIAGWIALTGPAIVIVWWLFDRTRRLTGARAEVDWSRWAVLAISVVGVLVLLGLFMVELSDGSSRRRRSRMIEERRGMDEMRDGVLAAVARNLREPALAVNSHAKRLRDGRQSFSAAERNRLIENLADATEDLAATMDDLFVDVATRLDRLSVTPDTVELRSLAEAAMAKVGSRKTRSMSIIGAATAYVDPVYAAQILRSMVRIPTTLGAATISIELGGSESSEAEAAVIDDGPPWPPAIREALAGGRSGNPNDGPLERSAGAATELARIMGGNLEYSRGDRTNQLRLTAPAADPALRWVEQAGQSAWMNEDRLSVVDVQRAIEEGPERIVFQPIVDLSDPVRVIGFEALSRFGMGTPPRWFSVADRAGLQLDLELACIRKAVWSARSIDHGFVAINLSSGLLASGGLVDALQGIDPKRVVIELSESSQIDRYETAAEAIAELTSQGFRLALDDVGNSEIDLWRIVRLRPSVVKLDLSLARGIDGDPDRRAVASAMISVAHAIDALVVAEGIETDAELETMQRLGADLGQGFLFDGRVGVPATA